MLFFKQKRAYEIQLCLEFRCVFFFFQAEDGIRDSSVTGVQTCALPIFFLSLTLQWAREESNLHTLRHYHLKVACIPFHHSPSSNLTKTLFVPKKGEIGRASCRERV